MKELMFLSKNCSSLPKSISNVEIIFRYSILGNSIETFFLLSKFSWLSKPKSSVNLSKLVITKDQPNYFPLKKYLFNWNVSA